MKRPILVWAAILLPIWVVLILCTSWEPVLRDGWGHVIWHRGLATTTGNLWAFAKGSYIHNNPRFGQVLTLLVYTPGPWHVIVTPIVELALFWMLAALGLGRWPSFRDRDDALVFATIVAMVAATAPSIGPMLFYRPFTGNYLFGIAIGVAFLVPYRFQLETPRPQRLWLAPIMLVLGGAAGLCNEHTDPAIVALAIGAIAGCWWLGNRPTVWMIAGVVGMLGGSLALLFAPGQEFRYNGLATQQSTLERISDRTPSENGKIFAAFLLYAVPLIVWLVLGLVARHRGTASTLSTSRRWSVTAYVIGTIAILATLLASPKQGARLYFAPVALLSTALASWLVPQLSQRWARVSASVLAAAVLLVVGWRCVHTYRIVGSEFETRFATILRGPPATVVHVAPYTMPRSRYFLGEDFGAETLRSNLALEFHLAGIELSDKETQRAATPPVAAP